MPPVQTEQRLWRTLASIVNRGILGSDNFIIDTLTDVQAICGHLWSQAPLCRD
jgi:hypothetical protein